MISEQVKDSQCVLWRGNVHKHYVAFVFQICLIWFKSASEDTPWSRLCCDPVSNTHPWISPLGKVKYKAKWKSRNADIAPTKGRWTSCAKILFLWEIQQSTGPLLVARSPVRHEDGGRGGRRLSRLWWAGWQSHESNELTLSFWSLGSSQRNRFVGMAWYHSSLGHAQCRCLNLRYQQCCLVKI